MEKYDSFFTNLDRIKKLGYIVTIVYKDSIRIDLDLNDEIYNQLILKYDYTQDRLDFIECAIEVFDCFYSWYYEEGIKINNILKGYPINGETESEIGSKSKKAFDLIIENVTFLHNITSKVDREFNIDMILNRDNFDF